MVVPTIYVKLIQYFDSIEQEQVRSICDGFNAMRLNILVGSLPGKTVQSMAGANWPGFT